MRSFSAIVETQIADTQQSLDYGLSLCEAAVPSPTEPRANFATDPNHQA